MPDEISPFDGEPSSAAVGKPVALVVGMNDAVYDISHLLELDLAAPAMPERRSAPPMTTKPEPSGVACAQEALARELLLVAGDHEEMIRQYMSMTDDSTLAADW